MPRLSHFTSHSPSIHANQIRSNKFDYQKSSQPVTIRKQSGFEFE